MRSILKNNWPAFALYLFFIGLASYFILRYEKNAIHLYVNQYVGNPFLNGFFFWATWLGDGWIAPLMVLILAIVNARAGFSALCSWLLAAIVSTVLKYYFFDDAHRPYYIFQYYERHELNLVEGLHVNIHNSFPSGHATQAFAVLMSMCLFADRHKFKILFLMVAVLTAFSRVYLSQHWLIDIVAGSLIGTGTSILFYYLYFYRDKLRNADRPLPDLLRRKKE